MSKVKKYYWLKLHRDFFKRHDVKIIEAQENGKDYVLFYLKLLAESVDHDGTLRFSDEIPYDDKMLSVITNTNIDIVRSAVAAFAAMGLMEKLDDGTLFMSHIDKMIGSETDGARRTRAFRDKKALQCNTDVTKCNENSDTELDTELELEKEREEEKPKRKRFVPPSLEEIIEYSEQLGYNNFNAIAFDAYYSSNGWKVGKNKMADWKKAIVSWYSRDNKNTQTTHSSPSNGVKLPEIQFCKKHGRELIDGKCVMCEEEL